ncbi:hypothetical protein [Priestia megaterium]|uniref:hypothetical protein n=1 Tax=Priestia megaterium TaxID=1404 RepID=UPI00366C4A12
MEQGDIIEVSDSEALLQFALIGMEISLVSKHISNRYNINHYLEISSSDRHTDFYLISCLNYKFTSIEKQFNLLGDNLKEMKG